MAAYAGFRVKDRTAKLAKKQKAIKKNGVSMRNFQVERAAKAQGEKPR
jgi:hypothetical protein